MLLQALNRKVKMGSNVRRNVGVIEQIKRSLHQLKGFATHFRPTVHRSTHTISALAGRSMPSKNVTEIDLRQSFSGTRDREFDHRSG